MPHFLFSSPPSLTPRNYIGCWRGQGETEEAPRFPPRARHPCSFPSRARMTGVFDSLVADMHSTQITASSTYHQHQQPPSGGGAGPGGSNGSSLHKPQESPTLPVSTATDSSYYTNQQHPAGGGGSGGSPYAHMGSYQYHAGGLNNVPYSAKSGYDLGYTAAYTSYAPYGTSSSPANNEPGKHNAGVKGAKSA